MIQRENILNKQLGNYCHSYFFGPLHVLFLFWDLVLVITTTFTVILDEILQKDAILTLWWDLKCMFCNKSTLSVSEVMFICSSKPLFLRINI